MNKVLSFILPTCIKGDDPIIIPKFDENNPEVKIPRCISFELRLMFDIFIYTSVYYGILSRIHTSKIVFNSFPDVHFLLFLMILAFFLPAIISIYVQYKRKFNKQVKQ